MLPESLQGPFDDAGARNSGVQGSTRLSEVGWSRDNLALTNGQAQNAKRGGGQEFPRGPPNQAGDSQRIHACVRQRRATETSVERKASAKGACL